MQASGVSVPAQPSGQTERQYVPLQVAGNTLGVMEVGSKQGGEPLSPEERRVLTLFAAQASLAIDRTRGEAESTRLRALEETDRLKSSLLSAVSHDLRTPLSSIKASAAALLMTDAGWTEREGRELLHAIEDESDRLDRLVSNLLDLSRIDAGTLRPALDWYDVEELADSLRRRGAALVHDRPFTVDVNTGPASVRVDLVRIESAILNLIDNAVRYTPTGTPILVSIRGEQGALRIDVVDRGPGLTETQKVLVFDRHFRGREQSDRGQKSGLGLGLAICRGIAEAHGGSIGVAETPGGGATFSVVIPQEAPPVETTA
jgi:two-component system sensor histidine kinase KdpD